MCEDIKKQRHIKAFVLSDLIIFSRIKKESKDDYDVNASSAKDKEALAKGKRRYTLKEMCFVIDVRLAEPQDGDGEFGKCEDSDQPDWCPTVIDLATQTEPFCVFSS